MKYRIRLAVEEMIWQLLLPHLKRPHIRVRVEYSLKDRHCMIRVNYAGDPYDIRTSDNSLSLSLLNNIAESISYRYDEGEEMGNCTEIQIKDTN
ncbi:MAG: hypothetical protein IJJ29_01750 [Solobacterium sp.]|nr:hypothetical protein [Solobacterium sp.]